MKQLGLVNLHLLYDCGFELILYLQQLVAFVRKRNKRMEAYKVSRSTLNSIVHYLGLQELLKHKEEEQQKKVAEKRSTELKKKQ